MNKYERAIITNTWYLQIYMLAYRARIFKHLWSTGIDSKEWIPPPYVARARIQVSILSLAGRYETLFVVLARQAT